MEFGNKNKSHTNVDNKTKQSLFTRFRGAKEAWKKAEEDQLFFNSRLSIFELLSLINDAQSAVVDLHVSKQSMTYKLSFDLFYTKSDGNVMANTGFHTVYLTKDGYIPSYIINEVAEYGKADVRFYTDDIEELYNERSVKVDEILNYKELLKECNNSGITNLVFKDRVFYTRIECYKNGTLVNAIHVALINGIPDNTSKSLYPCGIFELGL